MESLLRDVLEISFKKGMGHIPSALSMLGYLSHVFKYVKPYRDYIVLGKAFGAQAYYALWRKMGYLKDISTLSHGALDSEIDFVTFSDYTLGNGLGVGIGLALGSDKLVYVNLSDACLQMGQTLEALLFMEQHASELGNLFVTIDYNNAQVLGRCSDIVDIAPVFKMLSNTKVVYADESNYSDVYQECFARKECTVVVNITHKYGIFGHEWHYRKIKDQAELDHLLRIIP